MTTPTCTCGTPIGHPATCGHDDGWCVGCVCSRTPGTAADTDAWHEDRADDIKHERAARLARYHERNEP